LELLLSPLGQEEDVVGIFEPLVPAADETPEACPFLFLAALQFFHYLEVGSAGARLLDHRSESAHVVAPEAPALQPLEVLQDAVKALIEVEEGFVDAELLWERLRFGAMSSTMLGISTNQKIHFGTREAAKLRRLTSLVVAQGGNGLVFNAQGWPTNLGRGLDDAALERVEHEFMRDRFSRSDRGVHLRVAKGPFL